MRDYGSMFWDVYHGCTCMVKLVYGESAPWLVVTDLRVPRRCSSSVQSYSPPEHSARHDSRKFLGISSRIIFSLLLQATQSLVMPCPPRIESLWV